MAIQISRMECSRSVLDDQKLKDDLEAYLSGRTVQGAEIISSFFNDHLAILCPIGPRADTSGESLRRLAEKLLGLLSERLPGTSCWVWAACAGSMPRYPPPLPGRWRPSAWRSGTGMPQRHRVF